MTIAYLNVATDRQHLDIQREEISSFAAAKDIHVDKWVMEVSGEKAKQPGPKLKLVLERLMGILTVCMEKDVTVYCINDRYIFDDRMDRQLMINVFKQVDEIDHSLVSIRTKDALEQVKSTGKRLGRPKGSESKLFFLDAHKGEIMNMLERGESVGSICEHFNVSKNTFYKYRKKFFRS